MEAYRFENINYVYPGEKQPALQSISFTVKAGDFVVVCGASGSGKTTLLRQLKEEHESFGFVMQNPSNQIVTDRVYHELAFGMENQGVPTQKMRHAIAEITTYFGMEDWLERETFSLSGGEKQLLNLASVLVMKPDLILFDEPTAQLDPMAAIELIEMIKRINTQMGITVILVEQRLEEVLAVCDKMLVLHEGRIQAYDSVTRVFEKICRSELAQEFLSYMPSYVRLYEKFGASCTEPESMMAETCPRNMKECRRWFYENNIELRPRSAEEWEETEEESFLCRNLFFRYERTGKDILRGVCYRMVPGTIYGIAGGNGSGKSTFLKVLTGALRQYHGTVKKNGAAAYLPQEPKYMFLQDKIEDVVKSQEARERFGLGDLLERHPYDVSGGQMQRLAMAYLYETEAELYVFDEPTKGLDPHWKIVFGEWMEELARSGKTVLIVTHDVEFAANYCRFMSMCFDGEITEPMNTTAFFQGHHFYTTAIHKIVRDRYPEVVSERSLYEK